MATLIKQLQKPKTGRRYLKCDTAPLVIIFPRAHVSQRRSLTLRAGPKRNRNENRARTKQ